jgi:hypothetical protein
MRRIAALASIVMVLGLIVGVAPLNVAGAAPAVAVGNPNSVVSAVSARNGDKFVFWSCASDFGLCEASFNARDGRWSHREIKGMGPLTSPPSASADVDLSHEADQFGDPFLYVFWRGTHEQLEEAYWTGRWHGPVNLGMGPLQSGPSSPSTWYEPNEGASKGEAVAWMRDDRLWYAYSSNPTNKRSWHGPFSRGVGTISSPPSTIDGGGGYESAWWEGQNGNLYSASLINTNGVKFGACDFGMGRIASTPSASWRRGLPTTVASRRGARAATLHPSKVTGNCPRPQGHLSYGAFGGYGVCWAGEVVNHKTKSGLWCMLWTDDGSAINPTITVKGPVATGHLGLLGSAPSLASYPEHITGPAADTDAFYMGSNANRDLWVADLATGGHPRKLGFGPLSGS